MENPVIVLSTYILFDDIAYNFESDVGLFKNDFKFKPLETT